MIQVKSIGRSFDNFKKYLDDRVTHFNWLSLKEKYGRYMGIWATTIAVATDWDIITHWQKYLSAYDDSQDHLLDEIMADAEQSLREHIKGL